MNDIFEDTVQKRGLFFEKFSIVCFFNENFDKKSSKMDIYKSEFLRYNIKAVGGTNSTASRTTVTRICEISSL